MLLPLREMIMVYHGVEEQERTKREMVEDRSKLSDSSSDKPKSPRRRQAYTAGGEARAMVRMSSVKGGEERRGFIGARGE
jgi:hypothetical protein